MFLAWSLKAKQSVKRLKLQKTLQKKSWNPVFSVDEYLDA